MERITTISLTGIKLLEELEGIKLKAYKDSTGIWTIGIGTTRYSDPIGSKVKEGDVITQKQAYELLTHDLKWACEAVDDLTVDSITQNQFDALVCFVYNEGRGNYSTSTLLKLINANPNDPKITEAFSRFKYAGGKVIQGLINRRTKEAALYFTK